MSVVASRLQHLLGMISHPLGKLLLYGFLCVGLGIGIIPSSRLHAQAISGDLVGTVSDATGGTVPNVTVTTHKHWYQQPAFGYNQFHGRIPVL